MTTPIEFLPRAGRCALLAVLVALGLAACGQQGQEQAASAGAGEQPPAAEPAKAMEGMDHSKMDHGDHQMTPEQFAELREKIPLYAVLTDEQIMANMGRMPPDWWEVLSTDDMQGPVGVLALGHGYSMGGNEQFKEMVSPIATEYPTAVAPGMAMMSGSHIQKAVDALVKEHGVKKIVVIPMEPGDESSLNHQWKYLFGMRDKAPYLSAPRVKTDAEVVFTTSPAPDPLMAEIMRDYALEVAKDPAKARLIIVSHGPETVEDNPREIALLEAHAKRIRETSPFEDVEVLSLQDDAVPEVRAANKAHLREMIKEATDQGREVVIVPMILTRGGFHARLQKDLDGLDYDFADRGLIEHPDFQVWINKQIDGALG